MVGAFQFTLGGPRLRAAALGGVLVLGLLGAGVLLAGRAAAADRAEARVSTSPEATVSGTDVAGRPSGPDPALAAEPPPLTRAAARRRVETISPVPWLARFGPVALERRASAGE